MKNFVGFYYRCSFNVCLWVFLSLLGFMFLSSSAFAQQSGDFYYTESGGTIKITGYTCPGGAAVIPSAINNMQVVGIGEYAFLGCIGLTTVTIPNSITSIGNYAFASCTGLTTAYFYGNAPSMGSGVFYSCSSNFTVCYTTESTGFTTPRWDGYPAAPCAETTSSTTTVQSTTTTTSLTETSTTTTASSNQCVAETIYGNDSEETELLREYRDKILSKSPAGRQMIKTYYELSPAISEVLQNNDSARASARKVLDSLMPAIREKVKQ